MWLCLVYEVLSGSIYNPVAQYLDNFFFGWEFEEICGLYQMELLPF